jgi:hypothetical protein
MQAYLPKAEDFSTIRTGTELCSLWLRAKVCVFLAAFLSFAKLKLPLSLHKVSITNDFKSCITQAHVIQELKMSLKGFEIEI